MAQSVRSQLAAARKRLKAYREKRSAELAAKHEKASKGYLGILAARASHPAGQVYAGTANRNKVRRRRAKNKVARRSRKRNRR